jgi:hypothetical protein
MARWPVSQPQRQAGTDPLNPRGHSLRIATPLASCYRQIGRRSLSMLCQEPAVILKSLGGLAESAGPEPFGGPEPGRPLPAER